MANILSLFDGMACRHIAMEQADIPIDSYIAYEIDKYAIQTATHNFPDIIEKGDVFDADFTQYKGQVDYLIGGSPCTYWSIAQKNNRETEASGLGWELLSQFVRALIEAEPKYFLYENNKSMSKAIRESITETFGFEPICINSTLVSAQNRQRLYWVGKREADGTYSKVPIEQPEDRGILLKDILETGCSMSDKSHCVMSSCARTTTREYFIKNQGDMCAEPVGCIVKNQLKDIKTDVDKSVTVMTTESHGWFNHGKTGVIEPLNITADGKSQTIKAQYQNTAPSNILGYHSTYGATGVAEPICHNIPRQVCVRKHTCDMDKLKELLRSHKNKTNKEIAELLNVPMTKVEHWFRTDDCFAIPDAAVWYQLKELLQIDTDEFDAFITEFEIKDNVFEKGNRAYDINGKTSTVMTGNNDDIIEPIRVGSYPQNDGSVSQSKGFRIYSTEGKSTTLCANGGVMGAKTGLYAVPCKCCYATPCEWNKDGDPIKAISCADGKTYTVYKVADGQITIKGKTYPIKLVDGFYIIRKLTVRECARLQTIPEWYEFVCSDSQSYKQIGNGWTIEIIAHLLRATKE